jgi:hypothetical protein
MTFMTRWNLLVGWNSQWHSWLDEIVHEWKFINGWNIEDSMKSSLDENFTTWKSNNN